MGVRVFVSIPVTETDAISELRGTLRAAGIRTSPPEQTHLTLRFIGDIPEPRVRAVADCVERAVDGVGPFVMTVRGVGAFPDARRPSVVWMGAEPADVLRGIAERLSHGLDAEGIPYDGKPFRPHVTLARVRDRRVPPGIIGDDGTVFSETPVDSVLVMRSELGPGGARHSVLHSVPLG